MVQSAEDRLRDNVPEALDRALAGRIDVSSRHITLRFMTLSKLLNPVLTILSYIIEFFHYSVTCRHSIVPLRDPHSARWDERPITIIQQSCSDSPLPTSQRMEFSEARTAAHPIFGYDAHTLELRSY
jgi:hypothetical protein